MTKPNVYIELNDKIKEKIKKIIPDSDMNNIHVKLVGVPILAIYQNGQIMDTPIPLTDELAGTNSMLKTAMGNFKSTMSNASSPNKTLTNASSPNTTPTTASSPNTTPTNASSHNETPTKVFSSDENPSDQSKSNISMKQISQNLVNNTTTSSSSDTNTASSDNNPNAPLSVKTNIQDTNQIGSGKRRKTNRKSHKRIRKTNRSRRIRW